MNHRPAAVAQAVARALLAALAVLLQGACSTFSGHPEPVDDPDAELRVLAPYHGVAARLACIDNPSIGCRNRFAAAGMRAVDIRFSQFETRLFRQTREAGFAATLATLGFTSAATLTGGSARAFSATAGLITAGRAAFDREMLAQQTTISIHAAMRARRAAAASRLVAGMNVPLQSYSATDADRDLRAYEASGNVLSALLEVNDVVGDMARKAEGELQQTIEFRLDPSALKLVSAVCTDAKCNSLDQNKLQQLLACMQSAGVAVDIRQLHHFWFKPEFAQDRAKVLPCMNL